MQPLPRLATFINKTNNIKITMEGGVIQQQSKQAEKSKKLELKPEQLKRLEKIQQKKSTPFKIKGQLREDIAAEVRKNELSMSAISTKFDVNKHAVIQIRRQELGR